MASSSIDGGDVLETTDAARTAVAAARAGQGPVFVEARTVRAHGHYVGDTQPYRDGASWQDRDPLALSRAALGDAAAQAQALAVQEALQAPYPDPASVLEAVHG